MDNEKSIRRLFKKKPWNDDYTVDADTPYNYVNYVQVYPYMKKDYYNKFYLFLCEYLELKTNMLAINTPVGRIPLNRHMLRILWTGTREHFNKAYSRLLSDGVIGIFNIEHTERIFINPAFAFRGKSFPSFLVFLFTEYATDEIYGHNRFNPETVRSHMNKDNRLKKDRRRKEGKVELRIRDN